MVRKSSLKTREAAFVLSKSYTQVRRMTNARVLDTNVAGICPESVRAFIRHSRLSVAETSLRLQALDLILQRRIAVPLPPGGRWGQPQPITDLPLLLAPSIRAIRRGANRNTKT
jgi:hypothetical protein